MHIVAGMALSRLRGSLNIAAGRDHIKQLPCRGLVCCATQSNDSGANTHSEVFITVCMSLWGLARAPHATQRSRTGCNPLILHTRLPAGEGLVHLAQCGPSMVVHRLRDEPRWNRGTAVVVVVESR